MLMQYFLFCRDSITFFTDNNVFVIEYDLEDSR